MNTGDIILEINTRRGGVNSPKAFEKGSYKNQKFDSSAVKKSTEKENNRNNTNSNINFTEVDVASNTNTIEDLNGTQEKDYVSTQVKIVSNGNFMNISRQKSYTNDNFFEEKKNIVFNLSDRKGFSMMKIDGSKTKTVVKLPKINYSAAMK